MSDTLDQREYGLNVEQHFAKHGWAYIPKFVDKFECDALTRHMFALNDEGKMKTDRQCPFSSGIYGDPTMDTFLEVSRPKLSNLLNMSLLPTYTYARLYRTNETLMLHRDRPSCEISLTITLGHEKNSEIWPFFFSRVDGYTNIHRQVIDVGGALIYRGIDLWHWRQEYKGKWQTQVFLHYVDANGPNTDHAFDGREKLGDKLRIKKIID
jgi:hypothetical protein